MSNSLLAKVQLQERHINVDSLSPVCKLSPETTLHCFWDYSITSLCWASIGFKLQICSVSNFLEWLEAVFKQSIEEEQTQFSMICWAIWKSRNDTIWRNKKPSVSKIMNMAHSVWNQWKKANDKDFNPVAAFLAII